MGFSVGSKSKQRQTSETVYPAPFLDLFQRQFGRGYSTDELLGLLPQTQSLFGGGPIGYGGLTGAGGAPGGAAAPATGAAGGGGTPGTVPLSNINALIRSTFANEPPDRILRIQSSVARTLERQGIDPNAVPLEFLRGATFEGLSPGYAQWVNTALPESLQSLQPGAPRYGATGQADLSGLRVNQRIEELFKRDPRLEAVPWGFREVPTITAPVAAAQEMNVAPEGFNRYEQALYGSLYNPVERSLGQEGAVADRRLQAELAAAGLASSGTGVGQVEQQRMQRREQLGAAAQQAALQATTQRFGAEFAQQQFNAGQRQQTALANAGFDLTAQTQNAANVLAGDVARSENYLATIGLNKDSAKALRNDFLSLLGIAQADLQRLSQHQIESLGVLLNNWLQQGALLGNLGQVSFGTGKGGGAYGGGLSITAASSTS